MPRGIKDTNSPDISAVELRKLLHYDPKTGAFTWRQRRNGVKPDRSAGFVGSHGYVSIHIGKKGYQAHRLAWLYLTGTFPARQIDHRDLDRTNNRWDNLREAEPFQNCANRRVRADSSTGIKGIRAKGNKWRAFLSIKGKKRGLGYFDTPEEAHQAYIAAARQAHEQFARS